MLGFDVFFFFVFVNILKVGHSLLTNHAKSMSLENLPLFSSCNLCVCGWVWRGVPGRWLLDDCPDSPSKYSIQATKETVSKIPPSAPTFWLPQSAFGGDVKSLGFCHPYAFI